MASPHEDKLERLDEELGVIDTTMEILRKRGKAPSLPVMIELRRARLEVEQEMADAEQQIQEDARR